MLKDYTSWLAVVSVACLAAERILPWRREQRMLRPGLGQDVFWLVFNGYIATFVFAGLLRSTEGVLGAGLAVCSGRRTCRARPDNPQSLVSGEWRSPRHLS